MIILGLVITAVALLGLLLMVTARALAYLREHPELITNQTPLAYQRCQHTLQSVIARYRQIKEQLAPGLTVTWEAPGGARYAISDDGVEERRAGAVYALPWSEIGGVGVRMQPGCGLLDRHRDGSAKTRHTAGYSFHLLIVPITGRTLNILIPTSGRTDAIDFTAYTIALAERAGKRVNVFGFDRPPAPHHQRASKV